MRHADKFSRGLAVLIAALVVLFIFLAVRFIQTLPFNLLGLPGNKVRTEEQDESFLVGLVELPQEDDYKEHVYRYLKEKLKQVGGRVITLPSDRNQPAQIEAMRTLISYQVDVLIFDPLIEKGWGAILLEAADAGVDVISLNGSPNGEDPAVGCYSVGFDYEAASEAAVSQLLATWEMVERDNHGYAADRPDRPYQPDEPEDLYRHDDSKVRPEVLELVGPIYAYDSQKISQGTRAATDAYNLRILHSYSADKLPSHAKSITEDVLSRGVDIDLIIAQSEGMTLGVIDALKQVATEAGAEDQRSIAADGSTSTAPYILGVGGESLYRAYEEGTVQAVLLADEKRLTQAVSDLVSSLRLQSAVGGEQTTADGPGQPGCRDIVLPLQFYSRPLLERTNRVEEGESDPHPVGVDERLKR